MAVPPPPLVIEGILHQGCKMILGGTSKSNKSWCLLDLAMSVASGQEWWGRRCNQTRVIYINFELQPWAIDGRLAEGFVFRVQQQTGFGCVACAEAKLLPGFCVLGVEDPRPAEESKPRVHNSVAES